MRSSYINEPFWIEYCKRIFGDDLAPPAIDYSNNYFGGLEISGSNIFFANAIEDPW
jgi:hypothetical protein